ncbi:hypothetical protein BH18ACI4_BH18ACI4_15660 [soil metagenome]
MKHNFTAKEQSLDPTTHSELKIPKAKESEELDERIREVLQAASDKKALDLVVLDLREIATFTDHFVIASGNNERQVQAISDEVFEKLKKSGTAAARVEGYKSAEWILLDYGDFIVHVFSDKARKFYDLERLWRESKRLALPPEFGDGSNSSLRAES